jgi:hypothetical protein
VLKSEFEKAFETLDHDALLQIMKAKGFPDQFLGWVKGRKEVSLAHIIWEVDIHIPTTQVEVPMDTIWVLIV